jgi:hypothetical protein
MGGYDVYSNLSKSDGGVNRIITHVALLRAWKGGINETVVEGYLDMGQYFGGRKRLASSGTDNQYADGEKTTLPVVLRESS